MPGAEELTFDCPSYDYRYPFYGKTALPGGLIPRHTHLWYKEEDIVLQRDASGRTMGSIFFEQELPLETPRGSQYKKLWEGPNERYQAALRNDSVREIEALKDALPIDSFLLLDAAQRGAGAIIQFALANGVSPSATDLSNGDTPLHLLLSPGGYSKPFDQVLAPLTKLLEAGADANGKNKAGHTPLYSLLAIAEGDG